MPIKNYTTTVPAKKTIVEIQSMLQEYGATSIMIDYGIDKEPSSISFRVKTAQGELSFRLPANIDKMEKVFLDMRVRKPSKYDPNYEVVMSRIYKQAAMTGWRNIKDWIDAQLAIIETEMVTIEQVFLPYLLVDKDITLYDSMQQRGYLLTEGEK